MSRLLRICAAAAASGLAAAVVVYQAGLLADPSPEPGRADVTQLARDHLAALERRLGHPWPPVKGEPYPDVELRRLDGTPVRFSSLKGKVLLVEPVGMPCPACVAYNDPHAGPFRGTAPQPGVPSVDELLVEAEIDPAHPDLLHVQLLLYGTMSAAPSLEDARAWATHFQLERRPNTLVLVGDERLIDETTFALIPGFQLVDRDLVLRLDGTGHRPRDHPYDAIFPALRELLTPALEVADPFPPEVEPTATDALTGLLLRGDYARLEEELTRRREQGRLPSDYETALERALDALAKAATDPAPYDAWCAASPAGHLPLLVRGEFWIVHAWRARGGGWAGEGGVQVDDAAAAAWYRRAARHGNSEAALRLELLLQRRPELR